MTTAVERAPIHESSVRSDAGSSATFLPSAPSWPIASWTEDYKRNRHATAHKRIEGGPQMTRTSPANSARVTRRSFAAGAGVVGLLAASASLDFARAQGGPLKVGVLLPRSGAQAGIGQDCQRGVELASPIFKELGLPELAILNADTETNIEAAPQITEQGYKFVFRNFPTAAMILSDAFANQKELFEATGVAPKSVVFMHVNDTFGTAMARDLPGLLPKFNVPYKIVEQIAYDPTARDLSVEVAKAKATGAEALLMVSRLNDAILITRELVKQRWSPMAVLSMGPGWYEDQYLKTLGKLSDGPMSFVPWYDPHKKLAQQLEAALAKAYPGINLNTNHVFTFEALLVAADAYKRALSSEAKALADAIRTTNITDNVSIGPGIQFNDKGQNDKLKNAAIQNRGGKLLTIAPKTASNAKPELPMSPYDRRG